MDQGDLLRRIVEAFEALEIPYMVSGGGLQTDYIADWAGRLGLTGIWESIRRRATEG